MTKQEIQFHLAQIEKLLGSGLKAKTKRDKLEVVAELEHAIVSLADDALEGDKH